MLPLVFLCVIFAQAIFYPYTGSFAGSTGHAFPEYNWFSHGLAGLSGATVFIHSTKAR
jgi:hypothetical protein